MCGRFVAASSPTLLAERFHAEDTIEATVPDYNVAPREDVTVVRERADGDSRRRVLSRIRWGLVPAWAKVPSVGDRMINARAETLRRSSAYQVAFEKRRCLIPADGFYEWEKLPPAPGATRGRRQPYLIHRRDGEPMAFAGLWAVWKVPEAQVGTIGGDDGWLRSCSIVTTEANALLEPVHNRMPVVLPEGAWDEWLDPTPVTGARAAALAELLVPAPDAWFEMFAVSERVNRVLEKGPELVRPIDAPGAP
jgi:putative SOS response-associated peptidase YedK